MAENRKYDAHSVLAGRKHKAVLVAVRGLGSMNNSQAIFEYVRSAAEDGAKELELDLKECRSMDSTFMGTLILLNDTLSEKGGSMRLVSVSMANRDKLDELGISNFLDIREEACSLEVDMAPLCQAGKASARMELIEDAHEELVRKDKRNEGTFGPFLAALRAANHGRSVAAGD